MKRVLITGATGFVGANLLRRLLHDGHELHALVRPGFTSWRIDDVRDHVQLHMVDLGDDEALNTCVAAIHPEWVFHLAVNGAYSWQTSIHEMIRTNITSTVNLVEACLKTGFGALVNTGSSSEYGYKDHPPTEEEWVEPNSYYAVTKVSATQYCRYIARRHQANMTTLRLYSVYGPYEESNRLIPTLIAHGLRGELPPLADPSTARDFIYIDDVSEAFVRAAAHSPMEVGAVYNVGTGVQTTLFDVVAAAKQVMAIPREPVWGTLENRSWDTSVWVANIDKIKKQLGWEPQFAFLNGLHLTVEWLQENETLHTLYQVKKEMP